MGYVFVAELHATPVEYGARISQWWVLGLMLLLGVEPLLMYLTARYPTWNGFRKACALSFRNVAETLGVHPHPRHA